MRHREQRENEVRTQKLSLGFSRLREQIHVFFSFAVLYSNFVKAGTKVVNEVETWHLGTHLVAYLVLW